MKKIIAATDFSSAARHACLYAADMAAKLNAELVLFHVISIPVSASEVPIPIDINQEKKDAVFALQEIQKEIANRGNCKITTSISIHVGTFFYELDQLCKRIDPLYVIIGCQGTAAVEIVLFGSHATYTMKHLLWPVITVPENAEFGNIKTIGFACDFEHVTETVPAEQIKAIVQSLNAELHIINTGRKTSFNLDTVFESGLLREMFQEVTPSYDLLTSENDDQAIIEFAEKNKIDLLIVLPKRHSLIDRLLHQSHTRRFVLYSGVPVLALHNKPMITHIAMS